MYKIKNKMDDVRKLWDSYSGRVIFLEPGEKVILKKDNGIERNVFDVELHEEKEEPIRPKARRIKDVKQEVIEDDSSSDI